MRRRELHRHPAREGRQARAHRQQWRGRHPPRTPTPSRRPSLALSLALTLALSLSLTLTLALSFALNLAPTPTVPGETAIDLAEDDDTYKALAVRPPSPTLKRKRNLSTDSAAMEAALPTIAETFYTTASTGDLAAVRKLCTQDAARAAAQQVASVLASKVRAAPSRSRHCHCRRQRHRRRRRRRHRRRRHSPTIACARARGAYALLAPVARTRCSRARRRAS